MPGAKGPFGAKAQAKVLSVVGDEALDDLVEEEYRANMAEEAERFRQASQGSSWLGKMFAFGSDGKSEIDFDLIEVRNFINSRIGNIEVLCKDYLFELAAAR